MTVLPARAHDLPERLELPLASGEPWWYWLGGRPALDFANTLRERWRRRVECLATTDDLSRWLVAAGLASHELAVSPTVLAEARDLREAIDACVAATLAGAPVPPAAIARVDDWLVHAGARPQLALGQDGVPVLGERAPADSARRALGTIALDAATMLGIPDQRERIRICASETCSARFYDRSPAGRRRWCSMIACGNEAKARRHRARSRSAAKASA
jgi:predicted RNA-binding Zn ribbon-like protein